MNLDSRGQKGREGDSKAIFNEGCGFLHIPSVFQSQVWLHVNVEEENTSHTVLLKHNQRQAIAIFSILILVPLGIMYCGNIIATSCSDLKVVQNV